MCLISISLVICISITKAQDTVYPLVALSSNEISFYGKEGSDIVSYDLRVIGLVDKDVTVKLSSATLYDNKSSNSITLEASEVPEKVKKNIEQTITLELNIAGKKPGTYKGAIIATAQTTDNITTTNIPVTAKIEEDTPWYIPIGEASLVIVTIVLIGVALGIPENTEKFLWGRKVYSKRPWVIILGIIVVSLWLVSLVSTDIGEPSNMVTTVLVTPFILYVISYVKDKRTERLEKEKVSRTVQNEGIKEDVNLIRSLIGELSSHCASFNPYYCEIKLGIPPTNYVTEKQVVYHSSGIISGEVWKDNRKQGIVADIHTLYLEKYYDFVPKYNHLYRMARYLIQNPKKIKSPNTLQGFLSLFDEFREKFGELEKILFVYLSYILELWSRTRLSPMKVNYPRISRTLLNKLIDYEILKPGLQIEELGGFKEDKLSKKLQQDVMEDKTKSPRELQKVESLMENNTARELLTKFKEAVKDNNKQALACYDELDSWVTQKFRNKIDDWKFSAKDMEKITKEIYSADNITKFFDKFQKDFYEKYYNLKKSDVLKLTGLPTLPDEEEPEKKEYTLKIGNLYKEQPKEGEPTPTKDPFDVHHIK